ncbi:hypothetical protein EVY14_26740, partial [Escherichia coli]
GDQSVHGRALNTTLNGGYQYVHKDGLALNTVINEGGWQVSKAGRRAVFQLPQWHQTDSYMYSR